MKEIVTKMIRFANGNNSHWNYYTSGDYIKYITREGASFINPNQEESSLYNVNEDRFYTWDELEALKDKMHDLNPKQNVWDFVVSFASDWEKEQVINHPDLINQLIKEPLEKLFDKNHMKMENYEVFFALHENTDNKHIHLGFFEKNAMGYEVESCKPVFKWKGLLANFETKEFKEFAQDILKETDSEYYKMMKEGRQAVIDLSKSLVKENMKNEYGQLVQTFIEKDIHTFMFNKLDEQTKNQVLDLENKLINTNPELKESYQNYIDTLDKFAKLKQQRNEQYQTTEKDKDLNTWLENEKDDINVRIANGILKEVKADLPFLKNNFNQDDNHVENVLLKNIENDINHNQEIKINKTLKQVSIRGPNATFKQSELNYLKQAKPEVNAIQYSNNKNLNQVMKVLNDAYKQMNKDALEAYKQITKELEKELTQEI